MVMSNDVSYRKSTTNENYPLNPIDSTWIVDLISTFFPVAAEKSSEGLHDVIEEDPTCKEPAHSSSEKWSSNTFYEHNTTHADLIFALKKFGLKKKNTFWQRIAGNGKPVAAFTTHSALECCFQN